MTLLNRRTFSKRQERFESVYKLKAEISTDDDLNKTLKKSIDSIIRYIRENHIDNLPLEALEYQGFTVSNDTVKAACVTLPHRYLWALRMRIHSSGQADGPPRWWSYDIAIIESGKHLLFGMQVKAEMFSDTLPHYYPHLVPRLADESGLCQFYRLTGKPIVIEAETIDDLCDLLEFPGRTLPVVVISEINFKLWPFTSRPIPYLVNPVHLAKQLQGYAHVVQLSFLGSVAWTRQVGNAWAVFDGAVRVFMPHFDFDTSTPGDHWIHFKNTILSYEGSLRDGPEAYTESLINTIKKINASLYIDWHDIHFLPEARMIQSELEKLANPSSFAVSLYQQELEKRIGILKQKLEQVNQRNEELNQIITARDEEITEYQKHIAALQVSIETLSGFPHKVADEDLPEDEIPLSSGYGEMSTWAEIYLPNKLLLLPRAVHSLDKAEYRSPELVYKALLLLAFEYRNSRLGITDDKPFKEKCQELGLELRGAISKSGVTDNFFVKYPVGSNQQALLKFQLQKGVSRQKRYCLRIYFFWDEKNKLVVVGDLPAHLTTRIS